MSLTEKAFGALRWSVVQTIGEQTIRFAASIVIARLLLPQDYGLTAMLTIFMALGQLLISSGFSRAIVQAPKLSQHELSSVFYFNLAIAALCGAGLACSDQASEAKSQYCDAAIESRHVCFYGPRLMIGQNA